MFWIKRARQQANSSQKFEEDCLQLNVQGNQEVILKWRGRIQGHYPIFLPDSLPFICKLLHRSHVNTLHGGEALTMTKVWQLYWVPHLRALIKKTSQGVLRLQAVFFVRMQSYMWIIPGSTTKPGDQWIPKKLKTAHCLLWVYGEDIFWQW